MIRTIQGVEVEYGFPGRMHGALVAGIITYTHGNMLPRKPEVDDVWLYICEDHGSWDMEWIIVLRGGFEMSRINPMCCAEIEWAENPPA